MSNLTLWDIEKGIAELFDAIDEAGEAYAKAMLVFDNAAAAEAERMKTAAEQALSEYFAREVMSVDRIRGAYKHFEALAIAADQELKELRARRDMFARRCDSILAMITVVFEANPTLGVLPKVTSRRLEGRTGRLLYKGNGGLAPLEVTDPAAVPDECCKYVGWISGPLWKAITAEFETEAHPDECKMERVVDNERTRAALKTCTLCDGALTVESGSGATVVVQTCPACGGSGMGGVPGVRLGERGKHVEVK